MKERRDGFRLNLQLGCHFLNDCTPRAGIIEGTAGVACDYYNPWGWVSTFEAFDFRGHNRFEIRVIEGRILNGLIESIVLLTLIGRRCR